MHDFGHPVTFNEFVGDTDENGQRVDRQFRYFPNAQPKPVLVTDGGVGSSEEAMQEESISGIEGISITEDTDHELLAFYWQATAKYRAHHDAVASGEKPPAETPDGNPPREEMAVDPPTQHINGNPFTQKDGGASFAHGTARQPTRPTLGDPPTTEPPPPGLPTVEVDVQTFTDMQRQLIVGEMQPLIDLQDMVIQTQCILLASSLAPDSPHHQIMETWMAKLEALRFKLYGDPTGNPAATQTLD